VPTKTHPLVGCREKLKRAHKHIVDLNGEIKAFSNSSTHGIRRKPDAHGYILVHNVGRVPPLISVLIGEVVYQLRSALDHLVWQLVIANEQTPSDKNEFPIFWKVPTSADNKAAFNRKIKGISSDALALVEALQPYHRPAPKEDPLWVIHELNNIDKHRLLIQPAKRVSLTTRGIVELIAQHNRADRPEIFQGDVEVNKHVTVQVLLKNAGSGKPEAVVPLLHQLTTYVERVIREIGDREFS
jgi:hypothetical protein